MLTKKITFSDELETLFTVICEKKYILEYLSQIIKDKGGLYRSLKGNGSNNMAVISIKIFVALAIIKLIDQGEIHSDSTISGFLAKTLPSTISSKYHRKLYDKNPTSLTPPVQPHGKFEVLSSREMEVLKLIESGLSNLEIGTELHISLGTVKTHLSNIFGKLQVERRTKAVSRGRAMGLLPTNY